MYYLHGLTGPNGGLLGPGLAVCHQEPLSHTPRPLLTSLILSVHTQNRSRFCPPSLVPRPPHFPPSPQRHPFLSGASNSQSHEAGWGLIFRGPQITTARCSLAGSGLLVSPMSALLSTRNWRCVMGQTSLRVTPAESCSSNAWMSHLCTHFFTKTLLGTKPCGGGRLCGL